MKIHIVQKGDTLWKIAQKYNVNFEELKKSNSQLSNPDMIMPGMKIKSADGRGTCQERKPSDGCDERSTKASNGSTGAKSAASL
ncbi:SafA/ExsA family spore coat assembly protein [Bacillus sp. m3-13]|uniref:SafA/ExsA family spore coat assembly protein n=1 Tax=Bacillus sp. m3-13 TaxID=406124 RepID=UPI0002FAD181|nr:SafA/ExsA family spore coat assembly protein [Bacillus sp. m3-13]